MNVDVSVNDLGHVLFSCDGRFPFPVQRVRIVPGVGSVVFELTDGTDMKTSKRLERGFMGMVSAARKALVVRNESGRPVEGFMVPLVAAVGRG